MNSKEANPRVDAAKAFLKKLVEDDRSLKKRLFLAIAPSFLFVFLFILFGPVFSYLNNGISMKFVLVDVLRSMLPWAALIFVVIAGILLLLRGRLFDYAVCLVFGVSLGGVLQWSFFNPNYGTMDGRLIVWSDYMPQIIGGTIAWVAALALPFIIRRISKSGWKTLLPVLSLLLVAVQSLTFLDYTGSGLLTLDKEPLWGFSSNRKWEVSTDENIIVLLLDAFPGYYLETVMESEPEVGTMLKDFTYFRNYSSIHSQTRPALTQMFTSHPFEFNVDDYRYATEAWQTERPQEMFAALHEAGYETLFFTHFYLMCSLYTDVLGVVDNLIEDDVQVDGQMMVNRMLEASAFQFMPIQFKKYFLNATTDYDNIVSNQSHSFKNWQFLNELREEGLYTQDETKLFAFYHLMGPHAPYDTNADGSYSEKSTDVYEQTMGSLAAVNEYLTQLKELGLYDSSNIIIMTDHGKAMPKNTGETEDSENPDKIIRTPSALFLVKRANEEHTEIVYNQAPVTSDEFMNTVLMLAGVDTEEFGKTVYDFDEDEQRDRVMYVIAKDLAFSFPGGHGYNVLREYHFSGHVDDVILKSETVDGVPVLEGDTVKNDPREIYPTAVYFREE